MAQFERRLSSWKSPAGAEKGPSNRFSPRVSRSRRRGEKKKGGILRNGAGISPMRRPNPRSEMLELPAESCRLPSKPHVVLLTPPPSQSTTCGKFGGGGADPCHGNLVRNSRRQNKNPSRTLCIFFCRKIHNHAQCA